SLAEPDARLASLRDNAWIAAVALAAIAGLFSAIFVLRVVRRPVHALIRGTSRVAAGDLDTVIRVPTHSEMATLADSFNDMTRDLKRARAELRDWNHRLESNLQEKTAELGRTQRQIAHMDKMASLGRLSATVAHELNNPLAGIQSYAKLVERSLRDAALPEAERAELTRYLGLIQKEASRSGGIVKNLLSFARQSGGALSEQRLAPILERALLLVRHSLQMSQIQIESPQVACDDRLWCNADQIQQALVALFVNAVEAMPQGGKLSVGVEPRGDGLAISIRDTGCGIQPDVLPHIFEPFFTSKDRAEGAGLGLAVVYGIVQRHGGSIDVESEPGKGTTFQIQLPRKPAASPSQSASSAASSPPNGPGPDREPVGAGHTRSP
ncbi:MAG: HAMP domain-containing protein, partial [Planctomycetes bacterium]|nr:HAMP domain-containing protein [Planctomycetota bacterium]